MTQLPTTLLLDLLAGDAATGHPDGGPDSAVLEALLDRHGPRPAPTPAQRPVVHHALPTATHHQAAVPPEPGLSDVRP